VRKAVFTPNFTQIAQKSTKAGAIFHGHDVGRITSFTTGRGMFLVLPCDWRFLPKLGPLRYGARAFSLLPLPQEAVT
jgi:hypothetical protein